MSTRKRAALIVVALALPPVAIAVDAGSAAATPAIALDRMVVVASKVAEPIQQVVGSISVIERGEIERTLSQDIRDMVRYQPGVSVVADPGRFGLQGFSIRGLDGNRVGMVVDDVPLPKGFGVGSFSRAGRDLIDVEAIEQVEILRGPASTLWGSDALAGIVNYRTREPTDFLARGDGRGAFYGARAGYSGRDDSVLAGAGWAAESGPWQAMVSLARREGSESENSADDPRRHANPADTLRQSALLKLIRNAGALGRWRLTLDHSRSAVDTDVQSLVNGPGQFSSTTALITDDRARRTRISADGRIDTHLPWLDSLTVLAYGQNANTRQHAEQHRRPEGRTRFFSLRVRDFAYDEDARGFKLLGQQRGDWLGIAHWNVVGVEFAHTRYRDLRDGFETNLDTGVSSTTVIGERLPVRDFPNSTGNELGVFWQDEMRLGERLALIPALRWERYRLNAHPDATYRDDNPDGEPADIRESRLTARLGARWKINARSSVFVQYAEGFRAPPFGDVNVGFTIPAFNFVARPNPNLESETSKGFEAGWRYESPELRASLAVFNNRYHNLIESRANLGTDPESGALIFQSVNRDRARIRGIEGSLDVALETWSDALAGWRLRSAAAWTEGDDTRRNQPLNTVDPARLVLGIGYDSRNGRFGGELVGTGVQRKTDVDSSTAALFRSPGYGLLDLLAWWRPTDSVRINAGVFNLADRKHWDWASSRKLLADAPDLEFFTGAGRNASVTLYVEW
ncbi:MAG: hypothetical protein COZ47_02385 [Lysobacterales bacterium CG_4_10_14_3_um_filter_64_11]|nr:MAG: hypothetical protein COZ47_02385 [Xanthomonadales bacterium CG_4_10_14_3_um_filter_64_11]